MKIFFIKNLYKFLYLNYFMESNETISKDIVRFKKIFANLPEKIRQEDIILVMNKKPYTWNAVYFEITNQTELGIKMIKNLSDLNIIWVKKISN